MYLLSTFWDTESQSAWWTPCESCLKYLKKNPAKKKRVKSLLGKIMHIVFFTNTKEEITRADYSPVSFLLFIFMVCFSKTASASYEKQKRNTVMITSQKGRLEIKISLEWEKSSLKSLSWNTEIHSQTSYLCFRWFWWLTHLAQQ